MPGRRRPGRSSRIARRASVRSPRQESYYDSGSRPVRARLTRRPIAPILTRAKTHRRRRHRPRCRGAGLPRRLAGLARDRRAQKLRLAHADACAECGAGRQPRHRPRRDQRHDDPEISGLLRALAVAAGAVGASSSTTCIAARQRSSPIDVGFLERSATRRIRFRRGDFTGAQSDVSSRRPSAGRQRHPAGRRGRSGLDDGRAVDAAGAGRRRLTGWVRQIEERPAGRAAVSDQLTAAAAGARPQLPRARPRRTGAADSAVRPRRRQVHAVARRRRRARRAAGSARRRRARRRRRSAFAIAADPARCRSQCRAVAIRHSDARSADDADQLPRAGAGRTAGVPYTSYEARHLIQSEGQLQRRREAGRRSRESSRTRSSSSASTASGLVDVFQTPFGSRRRCRASSCTPASPTASSRTASSVRRAVDRGARGRARGGSSIGLLAALPAVRGARPARRWSLIGGWTCVRALQRSRAACGCHGAAARWRWRFALFARHRLPLLRRGPREAESQAAVRPIRLEGRLQQLLAHPELARAGRPAPRDDGAVLRHPRFHDRHREGRARGARRAAERVLLADGGRRVPPPGHGRQVRRRHGDGAVRRAARRRRPCRARGRGGGGDGARAGRAEPEVGGRGAGRSSTSASASTPAR